MLVGDAGWYCGDGCGGGCRWVVVNVVMGYGGLLVVVV